MTSDPTRPPTNPLRLVLSPRQRDGSAPYVDFELIVEQNLSLVVFMDAEGIIEYVNPRFCEITGYSAQEVLGKRIHELGELPVEQAAEIWSTVSRGEPWRGEFEAKKKGGESYWVYSCISPISSPAGEVTNYLAVNLDISDRKAAEVALQERDSFYRSLLEEGADVVTVVDTSGAIRYISPSVTRILGYEPEALIGTRAFDLVHPDDVEDAIASLAKAIAGGNGGSRRYRDRVRHADGTWRTVESVMRPLADGTGIVVSLRDMTARMEAEQALRRSEARFRSLVEDGSDVIAVLDKGGAVRYLSPSGERVFGFRPDEMTDRSAFDFIHPDDLPLVLESFERTIVGPNRDIAINYRVRDSEGAWRTVESMSRPLADGSGMVVNLRDITYRMQTEEALKDSEAGKQALLDAIPDLIFRQDREGRYLEFYPGLFEPAVSPDVFIGKSMKDVLPPHVTEPAMAAFERVLAGGRPETLEYELTVAGEVRAFEARIVACGSDEVLSVVREMTDRRRVEKELKESESRFRMITESMYDMVSVVDATGTIVYQSPSVAGMLGYTVEDRIGTETFDYVHPDDQSMARQAFADLIGQVGATREIQLRVRRKDGSWRILEGVARSRLAKNGALEVIVTSRDVTERRATEAALRESEQRLRTLLFNAPVVLFAWDKDGYFIASEGRGLEPLGRESGEVVGRHITELYPEDTSIYANFQRALQGEIVTDTVEVSGRSFNASSAPLRGEDGEVTGVIGVAIDITERTLAEEALRQSEERLRLALEGAQLMTWEWEIATDVGTHTGGNPVSLGDVKSPYTWDDFIGAIVTEDRERVEEVIQEAVTTRGSYEIEFRVQPTRGNVRWVSSRGSVILSSSGEPLRLAGVAMDVTERKEAERALQESQERLRLALDHAQMTSWQWDIEKDQITNTAESGPMSVGSPPLAYEAFIEQVHEDDRERVAADVLQSLKSGEFESEFRFKWDDGSYRWVISSGLLSRDSVGNGKRLFGVAMDITARKEAEEALRASEERFRYLLQNAPIVLSAWDKDGKYVLLEGKALEGTGIPAGSLVGQNLHDLMKGMRGTTIQDGFERALEGKIVLDEVRMGDRWWTASSLPLRDAEGEPVGVIGVSVDITERKRAEEQLRRSEERYRALYQDNPSMYFTVAEDGTVLSVNQFGAAQLGYTSDELVGRSVYDVFHKPDRPAVKRQFAALAKELDEVRTWEFRKVRKDGEIIWVKETVRGVQDENRSITFLVVCEDISERKALEAAMETMREQLESRAERAVARGSAYSLSFRELTVLDLVADGKSDKEIAVILGIRPMTVSKHVANVLRKMNAASRAEAGVRAWREGLIR
jgi:PAS domain S-box-containing protein